MVWMQSHKIDIAILEDGLSMTQGPEPRREGRLTFDGRITITPKKDVSFISHLKCTSA